MATSVSIIATTVIVTRKYSTFAEATTTVVLIQRMMDLATWMMRVMLTVLVELFLTDLNLVMEFVTMTTDSSKNAISLKTF